MSRLPEVYDLQSTVKVNWYIPLLGVQHQNRVTEIPAAL